MSTLLLTVLFSAATVKYSLPANLLESLCYVESNHRVDAINKDDGVGDSLGICQIKLSTAKWLDFKGTKKQLMKPAVNIDLAARYLKIQILRYDSVERGVVAYNRGNAKGLRSSRYSAKVLYKWRQLNEQRRKKDSSHRL